MIDIQRDDNQRAAYIAALHDRNPDPQGAAERAAPSPAVRTDGDEDDLRWKLIQQVNS